MKLIILILLFWCITSSAKREQCNGINIQKPPYKLKCFYDDCYYQIDVIFSINTSCEIVKYHDRCLNESSEIKCYNNLKKQFLNKIVSCVLNNCIVTTVGYNVMIVIIVLIVIFIIAVLVPVLIYFSGKKKSINYA